MLSGTAVSFIWLVHGLANREGLVVLQNAFVFVMSAIQLSLFAIYPSKPVKKTTTKKPRAAANGKKDN